ncbi:MAG: hypothetical protein NVS2B4_15390 [Ramlibacter sp.]
MQLGLLATHPTPHRVAGQCQFTDDLADGHALLVQPHDLGMHLDTSLKGLPLQPLRTRHRRWDTGTRCGCYNHHGVRRAVAGEFRCSPYRGHVPLGRFENRGAAVLEQMPSIGHVDRLRCTAATAIGVAGATVTGDHLDTGVGTQPSCKAVRVAVGQQIHNGPAFQVDENRAVALAPLPSPVIDPEHAGRCDGHCSCPTTDKAEQGRAAHRRADPLGQARAGLAAECEADVFVQAAQACRSLGVWLGNSGQAFGKDAVRAARPPAAQPAHPHLDLHAVSLPGQVR